MRKIIAKFSSHCADTGRRIIRGQEIYYDTNTRKAYHPESGAVQSYLNKSDAQREAEAVNSYIAAQEDAYWNNVTSGYYSR